MQKKPWKRADLNGNEEIHDTENHGILLLILLLNYHILLKYDIFYMKSLGKILYII